MPFRVPRAHSKAFNSEAGQSKFYGVHRPLGSNKWVAKFKFDHNDYYLGSYSDDRAAAIVYALCNYMLTGTTGIYDPLIGIPEKRDNQFYVRGPINPLKLEKDGAIPDDVGTIGPIPKEVIEFCTLVVNKIKNPAQRQNPTEAIEQLLTPLFPVELQATPIDAATSKQPKPVRFSESNTLTSKRARTSPAASSSSSMPPLVATSTDTSPISKDDELKNLAMALGDTGDLPKISDVQTYEYEMATTKIPQLGAGSSSGSGSTEEFGADFLKSIDDIFANLGDLDLPDELDDLLPPMAATTSSSIGLPTTVNGNHEPFTLRITTLPDNIIASTVTFRGNYYAIGLFSNPSLDLAVQIEEVKNMCHKLVKTIQGIDVDNYTARESTWITAVLEAAANNNVAWQHANDSMRALESPFFPQDQKDALAQQLAAVFLNHSSNKHHLKSS